LVYKQLKIKTGYILDLLVENQVIIVVKTVDTLKDIHLAEMLTYLKISKCKLGLILNFNVMKMKDGVKRVANNL